MTRKPNRSKRDLEHLVDELKEQADTGPTIEVPTELPPDEVRDAWDAVFEATSRTDPPDLPGINWSEGEHPLAPAFSPEADPSEYRMHRMAIQGAEKRLEGERLDQSEARLLRELGV